jgi:hypothetical protein
VSTADRQARLQALKTATTLYATKRREQLKEQAASNKKILKGRTGSERLAQTAVQSTSDLVVDEIDEFIRT